MLIRKHFLPHTLQDIAATTFFLLAIPVTYWFEIWVVAPEVHSTNSYALYFTMILGTFLLFNIVSNVLATMMCDTSIRNEIMTPSENSVIGGTNTWHFCATCETLVPPRSWHCRTCRTCILKRDHHCIFTGSCIGHKNHRFFMGILFYLFVATVYSSVYNNYFIWGLHAEEFLSWTSLAKILFPMLMLIIDVSSKQYYLLIYLVNMVGMLFSGVLLYYHYNLIVKGAVVHEKANPQYNFGRKKNLEIVFGKRWRLAWIAPFINSPLPHDGIHWDSDGKKMQTETNKGR